VQPFQHGHVGIVLFIVRVDPVVDKTGENLVVARVRKVPSVRDSGATLVRRIAEHLPLFRDRLPEKRKQRLAAFFRGFAPEAGFERLYVLHETALRTLYQQCFVAAAKDLLPAQAVVCDEDDVPGLARTGVVGRGG